MRRDVSQHQQSDRADETLRAIVRLLARSAARDALEVTPQSDARLLAACPEGEDNDAK